MDLSFETLGLPAGSFQVRDLWLRQMLGHSDRVQVNLRPHASMLYKISNGWLSRFSRDGLPLEGKASTLENRA